MMALAGVEPETLVSEPDALTTRPPPCALEIFLYWFKNYISTCFFNMILLYFGSHR